VLREGTSRKKLLNAFLEGVYPFTDGTEEIFDIFNRNAFVFYNVTDPLPALERIRYLKKMKLPIWK
jgi:hypothetical protein